jgi:hypothetical protein
MWRRQLVHRTAHLWWPGPGSLVIQITRPLFATFLSVRLTDDLGVSVPVAINLQTSPTASRLVSAMHDAANSTPAWQLAGQAEAYFPASFSRAFPAHGATTRSAGHPGPDVLWQIRGCHGCR